MAVLRNLFKALTMIAITTGYAIAEERVTVIDGAAVPAYVDCKSEDKDCISKYMNAGWIGLSVDDFSFDERVGRANNVFDLFEEGDVAQETKSQVSFKAVKQGYTYKVSIENLSFLKSKLKEYAGLIEADNNQLQREATSAYPDDKKAVAIERWFKSKDYVSLSENKEAAERYYSTVYAFLSGRDRLMEKSRPLLRLRQAVCGAESAMSERLANDLNKLEADRLSGALNYIPDSVVERRASLLKDAALTAKPCDLAKEKKKAEDLDKAANELSAYLSDVRGWQDLLDSAAENAKVVKLSRRLKLKGWARGLSYLTGEEYLSEKYINYLVLVSDDTDYVVAQSSGKTARMESEEYSVPLIINFGRFPPPKEGATLVGRYLKLVKVGPYMTTLGASRNALFFDVVQ